MKNYSTKPPNMFLEVIITTRFVLNEELSLLHFVLLVFEPKFRAILMKFLGLLFELAMESSYLTGYAISSTIKKRLSEVVEVRGDLTWFASL